MAVIVLMISIFKSQSSYNSPVSYENNRVTFLSLTLSLFVPCRPDLWNKQKRYTENRDYQVRKYVEDLSNIWEEEYISEHYCVWKPDTQASYCREHKLVHLLSVLKVIQVYFPCEGGKNDYTQNGGSIHHTEYDY